MGKKRSESIKLLLGTFLYLEYKKAVSKNKNLAKFN